MMSDHTHKRIIDDMLAKCPMEVVNRLQPYRSKDMMASEYVRADYKALVTLNANLSNQLLDTKRREVTYEQVLEQAFFIEDLHKN